MPRPALPTRRRCWTACATSCRERWAEDAALVGRLRDWLWAEGRLRARLMPGKDESAAEVAKFRDYFDFDEAIRSVPSHRALAVFRARALDILEARLAPPDEAEAGAAGAVSAAEGRIAQHLGWRHAGRAADDLLRRCIAWTWKVKLSLSLERDLFGRLREEAEGVAIKVFADNLRDLLLAAPAGRRAVMGLDPGIRTGVKVAVVSDTGKVLDTHTVYPHEPRRDWEGALHTLGAAGGRAWRRPGGHRQRHRQPRDRCAGGRPDAPRRRGRRRSRRCRRWWSARPARRCIRPANSPARNCPSWMSACAARSASRAGFRTRWPSW